MPKALAVPSKGVLVLLILMLVLLSGPAGADPGLSAEGMNKNSLVRMAGLYLTRSEVLTEGRPTKVRLGRRISCDDSRVRLLVSRDFDNEKAGAICGVAEKALAFSVNQSGGQRASVEIRVVPPRVFYSDTSWRLGRFPKLALVVPDLPDRHAMLANVADLVAHEVCDPIKRRQAHPGPNRWMSILKDLERLPLILSVHPSCGTWGGMGMPPPPPEQVEA